jgi:hypothetical protein
VKGIRKTLMIVAAAIALADGACSKDREVLASLGEFDAFSLAIVKSVKTARNPSAGVDTAQKYLDQNRAAVRQKLQAIKNVRNFQISDETRKKLEASLTNGARAVAGLPIEYLSQVALDAAFRSKMEKLLNDYKSVME